MSKYILSLAAMLVCLAGSARAEEGISANTLSAMGLSGLTVVSDSDALAIRGMGFRGGDHSKGCKTCGARGKVAPYSRVGGSSFATIGVEDGGSHSQNSYFAEGPYGASGDNYSEAGSVITNTEVVTIDGITKTVSTTCSTLVFAGGSSSAMSF
jgi:hypothetical protein